MYKRIAKDLRLLHADSEDSDRTGRGNSTGIKNLSFSYLFYYRDFRPMILKT